MEYPPLNEVVSIEDLKLDILGSKLVCSGKTINLGEIEMKILVEFMQNPYKIIKRNDLVSAGWETPNYEGDTRILNPYITRLREKLSKSHLWQIESMKGFGYRLVRKT